MWKWALRRRQLVARNLDLFVGLDDVAYLDIRVREHHTALIAGLDLGCVVLLVTQGLNLGVGSDDVVIAQQANLAVADNLALGDHAAGDGTHRGGLEQGADFGRTGVAFLVNRLEHALERSLDLFDGLVDDRVVTNIHALLGGHLRRLAFCTGVEGNDDGVGSRCERDVGLGHSAHTTVDDVELDFVLGLLRDFGLDDFYLELSTRDEDGDKKDKFIGSDEEWAAATATLEKVATETGLELVPDPGGAAYYGPKISVQARDAIGRTWQMSTIQYDFNMARRFELEYQAADGSRQSPVMIHSAKFGSIERFIGVLVEHYAGAFPVWLSPVQVLGVPVAEEYNDYLWDVLQQMRTKGIRVELDESDDRFPKKIRNASKSKVPFTLIAGEEDRSNNAVSFRYRDGSQENGLPIETAIERVLAAVEAKDQITSAPSLTNPGPDAAPAGTI